MRVAFSEIDEKTMSAGDDGARQGLMYFTVINKLA
jgi:hypothetical protein